eukprot:scaffold15702_cov66-Phaeocystis_antarctica.AAC.14
MVLQGGDRPLSRPVPVGLGQRLAALGATARREANPAVDAVAVALVALVHYQAGGTPGCARVQAACVNCVRGIGAGSVFEARSEDGTFALGQREAHGALQGLGHE